ncbi:hypothetical protein DRP04_03140 [Archaeoglobales archaeon]|nr:MAG: hypothetical protein DRP04_03140 [Archaeoglobales archaeon]
MGRSVPSVRMEVKKIAERWMKTARVLKKDERIYAERLARMAKRHSSEVFYLFDDPLEAAVFSVLIELLKEFDGSVDSRLLLTKE